ncbi:MAG: hypothetical protein P9X26_08190 [Candidatus Stygibacter frigidus]|nr:hypothetical protein [Candidatus Stygibacter frigidus]
MSESGFTGFGIFSGLSRKSSESEFTGFGILSGLRKENMDRG